MSTFSAIQDPHFIGVTITGKEDVYPALKRFFSTREPIETRADPASVEASGQ